MPEKIGLERGIRRLAYDELMHYIDSFSNTITMANDNYQGG